MAQKMKLSNNIKLVSFETKGGIYVYDGNELVGCIAVTTIINICKI